VTRVLYVIACGAGPATDLHELVAAAEDLDWDVCVGTTPAGWDFVNVDRLSELTGRQVRREFSGRSSGWPQADAVVVAPATINTVNKLAAGIADTWAGCTLIECMGLGLPLVVAPCVNPWLGAHPRFRANIDELRSWGVSVLWDDPTPDAPSWMVPWRTTLDELQARTS
jgi:phosphopantothenoylcysteine decarboxylase